VRHRCVRTRVWRLHFDARCETDLGSPASCGSCTNALSAGEPVLSSSGRQQLCVLEHVCAHAPLRALWNDAMRRPTTRSAQLRRCGNSCAALTHTLARCVAGSVSSRAARPAMETATATIPMAVRLSSARPPRIVCLWSRLPAALNAEPGVGGAMLRALHDGLRRLRSPPLQAARQRWAPMTTAAAARELRQLRCARRVSGCMDGTARSPASQAGATVTAIQGPAANTTSPPMETTAAGARLPGPNPYRCTGNSMCINGVCV